MASKKEIQQRVFKNGKPLDLDKFEWDEKTNTFSSSEDYLVLGFNGVSGCTFNTGSHCTFKTEFGCTFNTGSYCTFNTKFDCTFNTVSYCTFNTGSGCTFNTGSYCTFNTGSDCTFKTGENCVVVRKDTYEVIELKSGQKIKLKEYSIKGYDILEEEKPQGKKVKIRLSDNQVVEGEIIEDYPPNQKIKRIR